MPHAICSKYTKTFPLLTRSSRVTEWPVWYLLHLATVPPLKVGSRASPGIFVKKRWSSLGHTEVTISTMLKNVNLGVLKP